MATKPAAPPALGPKDLYLVLYNALCCLGWAYVLALGIPSLLSSVASSDASLVEALKTAGAELYRATPATAGWADESSPSLAFVLTVVQSAALLEILHAAAGLVRSPVFVTTMQVGSRIVALHMLNTSPKAQAQWGAALMIISWALVEVPRYLFYVAAIVTGDATKGTPFPLFWLRYSLFAVLYPSGISGELSVFINSSKCDTFLGLLGPGKESLMYWYAMMFPIIYAPGALPMIMNMAGNRKRAFKKRFAKPPPPPRGLVWPVTETKANGEEVRSSTPIAKEILAAAIGAVNPELAEKVHNERKWRFGYVKHLVNMVEAQCKSPEDALKVANAGLNKAYTLFQFVSKDGKTTTSFASAMSAKNDAKFCTGFVKGELEKPKDKKLEIAYKGKQISGEELKVQVKKWVDYGTIEPSAGEAILKSAAHPEWLDLSDRYFVLLGAGSAMGPFEVLMSLGANVVAVDLDRPFIWKRLIERARNSCGSITFPMTKEQKDCASDDEMYASSGCNLFTETPLIRDWLVDLYPGKPFTVGSYAYLNGALHVQVSLAMDAITRDLCERREGGTSLAYLCTPTDLHLIPKEAHDAAQANYEEFSKKPYCMLMNLLGGKKFLNKNVRKPVSGEGGEFYYVNGISVAQGPNYAMAKRMQHWRAIIARSKGNIVSSNVAPSTSTASVVQNRTFAWAYEGMPYFTPYEIFAPETSKSVMIAILFHDLNEALSVANPKTALANPNQLFSSGSFHGGVWRCAYEIDSIGECSVILYFSRVAAPYALALGGLGMAFGAKYFGLV
eukprot:CAMPEP_0172527112 /NCGR_PEP_ID=MMETSP1067-20121228/1866_1 /TAXON_ID=265564 ORGANISM="Thalassiosira punctigera, Strain Tpunct2005C2" /NCGR_SAMPLE_ID=MMETSP1067 /ASSEMBLY_ACC=CAM_ASM_000444 /LENGTH=786 /DNA_ID=CAMNT_0013310779 /DNA_START=31 /DNA_END=2391 /DNA_ORIENTATION=+